MTGNMLPEKTSEIYSRVKALVHDLGYSQSLIQENYSFADPLGDDYRVRRIPLAAFAQWPPSYRNVCIGVVISNGKRGMSHVYEYRALGAPLVFEISDGKVIRYKFGRDVRPKEIERVRGRDIEEMFLTNRLDWKPESILRAKGLARTDEVIQLDFIDAGLMPALEGMIHRKLDRMLRDLLYDAATELHGRDRVLGDTMATLFRLVFRLLAAKILDDRDHPGPWDESDSGKVLRYTNKYYGFEDQEVFLNIPNDVIQSIWDRLRSNFFFHNLSVDDLAYIYENTLITEETRKTYGIHSTPPSIAEYIVANLPFDEIDINSRKILEPFAGHAIFLIAAMRRMRENLPLHWDEGQRHEYFVKRLIGIEKDDFAREVARLSLMLADYPNPDGWKLLGDDVFSMQGLGTLIDAANILLCNPPFEDFTSQEKRYYQSHVKFVQKPAEILHRVLENPPHLLGFVLPRTFLHGDRYRSLRDEVARKYKEIELVALPGGVFVHSDAEGAILLAHDPNLTKSASVRVVTKWVSESGRKNFVDYGQATMKTVNQIKRSPGKKEIEIWHDPLDELWARLDSNPKLGDIVEIHRGIEWSLSLRKSENHKRLISPTPKEGFSKGLETSRGKLEQFIIKDPVYLNTSKKYARGGARKFPWHEPKVIANAATAGRGPWRLTAAPDHEGLVCYQRLHGIWPKTDTAIELIAAILNGPIANAFMYFNEGRRDNRIATMKRIPIPDLTYIRERQDVLDLFNDYIRIMSGINSSEANSEEFISHRSSYLTHLILNIDALVLQAYNLPPKLEKQLLDLFSGQSRPVPFQFDRYFPTDFEAYVRLKEYIAPGFEEATAKSTLKRIKPISDPTIHHIIEGLEGIT